MKNRNKFYFLPFNCQKKRNKDTEHFDLIVLDLTSVSGGTRSLGKMGLRSTRWVAFNISKVALLKTDLGTNGESIFGSSIFSNAISGLSGRFWSRRTILGEMTLLIWF